MSRKNKPKFGDKPEPPSGPNRAELEIERQVKVFRMRQALRPFGPAEYFLEKLRQHE